ncbi:MAG: bifunctional phosphoribosyl-AMP cyclohydrolase/phosphoribosyl-ATP diphosphatase HisIE [Bacteroidota bacterium]
MRKIDMAQLDFSKGNGLIPAIVQDAQTGKVLMLGYMDKAALKKTLDSEKVTFYSRSKQRLWTKGESSGHFLELKDMAMDCDSDALLVKAHPLGPTCHTGADTCFEEDNRQDNFLWYLESIIQERKQHPSADSYTVRLFQKGINTIAQKVGEEAVETIIEAKDNNRELFLNEAADLMFHYLVLLVAKGESLDEVVKILKGRHEKESVRRNEKVRE